MNASPKFSLTRRADVCRRHLRRSHHSRLGARRPRPARHPAGRRGLWRGHHRAGRRAVADEGAGRTGRCGGEPSWGRRHHRRIDPGQGGARRPDDWRGVQQPRHQSPRLPMDQGWEHYSIEEHTTWKTTLFEHQPRLLPGSAAASARRTLQCVMTTSTLQGACSISALETEPRHQRAAHPSRCL